MSISSVVVSLDGSRFAETAVPVAARLARSSGGRLRLVMAHEPTMAMVPAADIPITTGPDDMGVRAEQQTYLAGLAHDLGRVGAGPVEFTLVDGLAGPTLVDELERARPDLLVMATHGRGPLSRFWLGSVADHLLRHASTPILLMRPHDGDKLPVTEVPLATCLIPLDRSPEAEAILGPATDLARITQAHVTLMTVIEPVLGVSGAVPPYPVAVPQEALESLRVESQKYLDEVADRLRAEGLRVATRVVVGMGVATTILEQADQGKFDFVAMSTHGAGGFRRLLLGSVADKVVRGSGKPVLVFRPAVV
ncbi:MAG: universal stress protein [Gemmatimonadales bacterium]